MSPGNNEEHQLTGDGLTTKRPQRRQVTRSSNTTSVVAESHAKKPSRRQADGPVDIATTSKSYLRQDTEQHGIVESSKSPSGPNNDEGQDKQNLLGGESRSRHDDGLRHHSRHHDNAFTWEPSSPSCSGTGVESSIKMPDRSDSSRPRARPKHVQIDNESDSQDDDSFSYENSPSDQSASVLINRKNKNKKPDRNEQQRVDQQQHQSVVDKKLLIDDNNNYNETSPTIKFIIDKLNVFKETTSNPQSYEQSSRLASLVTLGQVLENKTMSSDTKIKVQPGFQGYQSFEYCDQAKTRNSEKQTKSRSRQISRTSQHSKLDHHLYPSRSDHHSSRLEYASVDWLDKLLHVENPFIQE